MRNWFIFIFWVSHVAVAQQIDSLQTKYLQEVNVYGMPVTKYSAGTTVETIKPQQSSSLLDDAFVNVPSVYFKTYGNNQVSAISLRGTSASHTAILWNGININSPSLGQTDFSLLPVFLLDDISLQLGTSSSLYGSDALGGSVLLNAATPVFKQNINATVQQDVGSFGNVFSGVKFSVSNRRWVVQTKVMNRSLENDFPYTSRAIGYSKKQEHAGVDQFGFDQQIHYKFFQNSFVSLEAFYTDNFRQIQPPVTNSGNGETLKDTNTRINLRYQSVSSLGEVYASLAYIDNQQVYNRIEKNATSQYTFLFNVDSEVDKKLSIRYGASASLFQADVDSYRENSDEKRCDVFASLSYRPVKRLFVSFNARQTRYANHYAPFAPSVGIEYKLLEGINEFKIKSQASRGYRVPTLNDRYWNPGGNPDLLPEDAWHVEGGLTWEKKKNENRLSAQATVFNTYVDHWILWLPKEVWIPVNLQKVNAFGIEASVNYVETLGKLNVNTGANYSYTRSKNLKPLALNDNASVNSQLPYVPFHASNFYSDVSWKDWNTRIMCDYTGFRYTTLDNNDYQSLNGYLLVNLSLSRSFVFKEFSFTARGTVNNIFNIYYENLQYHAMPGINYTASLIINFNQSKKE